MGGGGDSRIPSILKEAMPDVAVTVRTYDFDPEVAASQIEDWVAEIRPDLVVGESLGSIQTLRIKGLPYGFAFVECTALFWLPCMAGFYPGNDLAA